MKGLIKKVSILILSVLVLVGGSLGGVSSVYAKSFYQLPDPYVMDKGYQNLLKYRVLGYKDKLSDALKVSEDFASKNFPRRRISNNEYLSRLSFGDSFKNGYEFIEFLIRYHSFLESGVYIVNIGHYYNIGSYYYIISVGGFLDRVPSSSSNSSKKPALDPYVVDESNEWLYRYKVVGFEKDLFDALRAVEGHSNKNYPKMKFEKEKDYPQKYFFKDGANLEDQYRYGFKNGYAFISFLEGYRNRFERGHYILEIGNYYNGGSYYYIIRFE